ncbi:MAG: tripartite tricarboxylate transporter TctB family protein, partial [Desulfobacterales bacterium]|nr:tripartite tricarboxylate transporter TctB family protein [Desulfobacterales bacterium]
SDGKKISGKKGFENLLPLLFLVAYALSIEKIGFPVGTFLFLSTTFRYLGYPRWIGSCVISAIITSAIFILFTVILDVRLPAGDFLSVF